MSRRKGRKISGWINLDKPAGMTSAQAVGRVRHLFQAAKAGHAGTLDPLATGVLPIALGEATKTVPYLMDATKGYDFTVRWGEARDTDDSEGAVTATSDRLPTSAEIDAALPDFVGIVQQIPPRYSAIKVEGRRAYKLARAGAAVALEPREVEIIELVRTSHAPDGAETGFRMVCGKGTYVRALARDLAEKLGTCGYIAGLVRTRVGPFEIADSISLEKLERLSHSAAAERALEPVATALDDIPALAVTESEAHRLRCGQSLRHPAAQEGTAKATAKGRLVALVSAHEGVVHPLRVFSLD